MTKFKAPTLTAENRSKLERRETFLINLGRALKDKKARLDELNLTLQEVEARKRRFEQDAARDPDAALNLAGAEAQTSRLAPEIKQLQESLKSDAMTAVRQVNGVWNTEVRELLYGPLVEQQLQTSIFTAISPFFDADWGRHYARQIMQSSNPYRALMFYLNRPLTVSDDFEHAKSAIDALANELKQILGGETLIEA
jgi:hypothetical protein